MRAECVSFSSPIGTCALAWTSDALVAVHLPEAKAPNTIKTLRERLTQRGFETTSKPATSIPIFVQTAIDCVREQLSGNDADITSIPLDLSNVSPFHRKIYKALQKTHPGQTVSYGELAAKAGSPKAARAVGQAMAKNPWPLVVPCHRVLSSTSKLTGFSAPGGTTTKAKILELESRGQ